VRARKRDRYTGSEREKVRDKHTHKYTYTHVPVRHQTARPALETQCSLCYRENVLDRNQAERGEREGVEKKERVVRVRDWARRAKEGIKTTGI